MLRIKPTDDCIIQKLDCTTGEWVDWFSANCADEDLTAPMRSSVSEIVNTIHGAPDDRTLAALECVEYDLILQGNNQCILPVHVDQGDLITITNARGQVSENAGVLGTVATYYGPQGQTVDATSGYPAPAEKKMRLIMNIGGEWFDAYNVTDFEIPSGIVQDNLVFMVNDDEITDNMGTLYFHIKICKAETAPWAKVWDFAINDGGWEIGPGGTYGATWNAAGYWETSAIGMFINRTFPADADLSYIKVWFETDGPDQLDTSGSSEQFGMEERIIGGGSTQWFDSFNQADSDANTIQHTSNFTIHEGRQLELGVVNVASTYWKVFKIEIHGTGPQPDWDA